MAKLQANKTYIILKLFVVFSVGFFLWKYTAYGLQLAADSFGIDSVWSIVSSRLALLGYILPFLIWRHIEPQSCLGFYLGDIGSSIKMPFIFYGFKDTVLRVTVIFSYEYAVCFPWYYLLAGIPADKQSKLQLQDWDYSKGKRLCGAVSILLVAPLLAVFLHQCCQH